LHPSGERLASELRDPCHPPAPMLAPLANPGRDGEMQAAPVTHARIGPPRTCANHAQGSVLSSTTCVLSEGAEPDRPTATPRTLDKTMWLVCAWHAQEKWPMNRSPVDPLTQPADRR